MRTRTACWFFLGSESIFILLSQLSAPNATDSVVLLTFLTSSLPVKSMTVPLFALIGDLTCFKSLSHLESRCTITKYSKKEWSRFHSDKGLLKKKFDCTFDFWFVKVRKESLYAECTSAISKSLSQLCIKTRIHLLTPYTWWTTEY